MRLQYLLPSYNSIATYWQDFILRLCARQLETIDNQLQQLAPHVTIYPPQAQILRALKLAPQELRVVILGQDPYHGLDEANGLAFAVNRGIKIPPSLRNIYAELALEYTPPSLPRDGTLLESWESQGVMLLNSTLSVIKDQANSMAKCGWQSITDQIISEISNATTNCVFILWGNYARAKSGLIDKSKHLILESAHPSPLSAHRGFLGNKHFTLANNFLLQHKQPQINWI